MTYEKTCIICGNQFIGKSPTSTLCSAECRKIRKASNDRKYRESVRQLVAQGKKPRKKSCPTGDIKAFRDYCGFVDYTPPSQSLAEKSSEAQSNNMSYGYYMAYKQRGLVT